MNWLFNSAVKCEMPPTFISGTTFSMFMLTPQYNAQLFAGWSSLYLQSFGPRLSTFGLPYNHSYAALHVRRGDKLKEVPGEAMKMF